MLERDEMSRNETIFAKSKKNTSFLAALVFGTSETKDFWIYKKQIEEIKQREIDFIDNYEWSNDIQ